VVAKRKAKTVLVEASDDYLQCRDLMHAWKWVTDFAPHREERKITAMTRTLVCMRCGTERHDEYELPSFIKTKSTYSYPEDYRMVGFKGHVPVAEVRRELYGRLKKKASD